MPPPILRGTTPPWRFRATDRIDPRASRCRIQTLAAPNDVSAFALAFSRIAHRSYEEVLRKHDTTDWRSPVGFSDVVPTVADVTGATPPKGIDGQSLLPLMKGDSTAGRDWIFSPTPRVSWLGVLCVSSFREGTHPSRLLDLATRETTARTFGAVVQACRNG